MHMTGAVLEEYSRTRNKDAEAICDLSMYNYLEVSLKSYSFWSAISFCHEIEVRHHVVVVLIHNMTVGLGGGRGGGTSLIASLKPQPNDRKMPTQHIATLLYATF